MSLLAAYLQLQLLWVYSEYEHSNHCASSKSTHAVAVNYPQRGVASKVSLDAPSAQPTERTRST
ncbi:hypothetical protein A6J66_011375 [Yersinia enterocolitica]|nr:hypothetical protein A6J66_011375 [Yersinia enterocolitica]